MLFYSYIISFKTTLALVLCSVNVCDVRKSCSIALIMKRWKSKELCRADCLSIIYFVSYLLQKSSFTNILLIKIKFRIRISFHTLSQIRFNPKKSVSSDLLKINYPNKFLYWLSEYVFYLELDVFPMSQPLHSRKKYSFTNMKWVYDSIINIKLTIYEWNKLIFMIIIHNLKSMSFETHAFRLYFFFN